MTAFVFFHRGLLEKKKENQIFHKQKEKYDLKKQQ